MESDVQTQQASQPGTPGQQNNNSEGKKSPEATQQDDLLSRVTSFMQDNPPKSEPQDDGARFDINDIDRIEDPHARDLVKSAYKSFESGYQRKFQELAQLRKSLESATNEKWTPERIQRLINDPEFVAAAQQVAGTNQNSSEDEYSNLSDAEKAKISNLERELANLRKQNMDSINQQEHQTLASRYSNYDPKAIDTIKADLISGKVRANNEVIYKAMYHDENVKKAYELGRNDERTGNVSKLESASVDGQNTSQAFQPLEPQEGESSKSFWRRIADAAVKQTKTNQMAMR